MSFGTTNVELMVPLFSVAAPRNRTLPSVLNVTSPASGSVSWIVPWASFTTIWACPETGRIPDDAVSRTVAVTAAWLRADRMLKFGYFYLDDLKERLYRFNFDLKAEE